MNTSLSTSSTDSAQTADMRVRLERQISRLQERQLSMVSETNAELELLREELAQSQELDRQPLLTEIEQLRSQVASLHSQHSAERDEMQLVLDTLKGSVDGQLRTLHQQLRTLSLDALQGIENMLDSLEGISLPTVSAPSGLPALVERTPALPVPIAPSRSIPVRAAEQPKAPAVAEAMPSAAVASAKAEPPARPPKSGRGLRRLVRRSFAFAVVAGLGFLAWHTFGSPKPESGSVAGVSTERSITAVSPSATPLATAAADEYRESLATVAFADTVWDHITDNDFGVSIDYPKNATDVVHAVGGENMFFLRGTSYMLKISRSQSETAQTLDQWIETAKQDYADDYAFAAGTFNNKPAYVATAKVRDDYSGTMYFTARAPKNGNPAAFYQVWAKDETPDSDDAKRQERMLTSLQFTN